MTRVASCLAVVAMLLAVHPAAWADDPSSVTPGTNSFEAMGQSYNAGNGADPAATASTPTGTMYSYQPACVRGEGLVGDGFYGCGSQLDCGEEGQLFNVWAHYADGTQDYLGEQCFEPDEAPPVVQQVTPELVLRAFRRIPLPASELSIQPPGGKTLVNLETIFSTEAEEFSRTIGLLGRRVELEIWPSQFRWVAGDGREFVTDWPGKQWAKGVAMAEFITHLYEDADEVTTRVDTTWAARYRVDGGPWREVGGVVTIEGEPFPLEVLSAGPRLVG